MKTKLIIIITLLISAINAKEATPIDYKQAKSIYDANTALWIDARDSKYYKEGTITGALNMPLGKFRRMRRMLPQKKNTKIVIFCSGSSCNKSGHLAEFITDDGYSNVFVFTAGYPKWVQMGQEILISPTKCQDSSTYTPTSKPIQIMDAIIYPGKEEGTVDPKWFSSLNKSKKLPKNIQLIDVRNPKMFANGHLDGAINIPWDADKSELNTTLLPKDKAVIFYCNTGMLSSDAYDSLDENRTKNIVFLNAGVKCDGDECSIGEER